MTIDDLINRISAPATGLTGAAPSEAELDQILRAGMSAPDHGGLVPWRFIIVRGEARVRMGELFAAALRSDDPGASAAALDAARAKPLRAPLILVVVAALTPGLAVPEDEQFLAAGACADQIVLGAAALDYGAVWLSGPYARHEVVRDGLGVAANEKVVGLIYIGGVDDGVLADKRRAVRRRDPSEITTVWDGPAQ